MVGWWYRRRRGGERSVLVRRSGRRGGASAAASGLGGSSSHLHRQTSDRIGLRLHSGFFWGAGDDGSIGEVRKNCAGGRMRLHAKREEEQQILIQTPAVSAVFFVPLFDNYLTYCVRHIVYYNVRIDEIRLIMHSYHACKPKCCAITVVRLVIIILQVIIIK